MAKKGNTIHKKPSIAARREHKGSGLKTKRTLLIAAGAVVLAVALFLLFYDDGSLPLKTVVDETDRGSENRQVIDVPEDEHWLTIDRGTRERPRYYRVGYLSFPPGWTNDESFTASLDKNIKEYCLRPDDADDPIACVYIRGVAQPPKQIAQSVHSQVAPMYAEARVGDIKEMSLSDRQAVYFSYITKLDREGQSAKYDQTLSMYVPAKYSSSILVNVQAEIDSMDSGLEESDLLAAALEAVGRLTIDE